MSFLVLAFSHRVHHQVSGMKNSMKLLIPTGELSKMFTLQEKLVWESQPEKRFLHPAGGYKVLWSTISLSAIFSLLIAVITLQDDYCHSVFDVCRRVWYVYSTCDLQSLSLPSSEKAFPLISGPVLRSKSSYS